MRHSHSFNYYAIFFKLTHFVPLFFVLFGISNGQFLLLSLSIMASKKSRPWGINVKRDVRSMLKGCLNSLGGLSIFVDDQITVSRRKEAMCKAEVSLRDAQVIHAEASAKNVATLLDLFVRKGDCYGFLKSLPMWLDTVSLDCATQELTITYGPHSSAFVETAAH